MQVSIMANTLLLSEQNGSIALKNIILVRKDWDKTTRRFYE